jgi:hypothetical protein
MSTTTRRESRPTIRKVLTDMAIKSAKPDVLPYSVYDTRLPNLVLFVHPTGSKAWKVRYSRFGKARWYHLGNTTSVPLSDARKLAADVMLRVAKGEDPHSERRAQRNAGTFAEMIEAYVKERGTKSMEQYAAQLRKWAIPRWGKMPAGAVTKADVRRLFNQRKAEAPGSAKLLLAAIGGAYGTGGPCTMTGRASPSTRPGTSHRPSMTRHSSLTRVNGC